MLKLDLTFFTPYISYVLYAAVVLLLIMQLYFLLYYHLRLMRYKIEPVSPQQIMPPVSIIISARNEAANLTKYLPSILSQDYTNFEVVVVNDCSSDNSDIVLQQFQVEYPYLKVVSVTEHPRFKTGKKFALTMGIKAASHEHLVFTDADCMPASNLWLAGMAGRFAENERSQIVLGYSPYIQTSGFVNKFTRFETVKTGINYLSAALAGNPYMGVGRNLAYTKTLFFSNKGFASHMHVMAGDDDLFVNQHANAANVAIQLHSDTFTYSETKTSFSAYFKQKRRHMGVGKYYRSQHRRLLSMDAVSGLLFYLALIICLALKLEWWIPAGAYFLRLILQLIIYKSVFKKLKGSDLLWWLPFFDFIYYLYLNLFGLIGSFIKIKRWK